KHLWCETGIEEVKSIRIALNTLLNQSVVIYLKKRIHTVKIGNIIFTAWCIRIFSFLTLQYASSGCKNNLAPEGREQRGW
ncbi:MAG: hypothetical protein K2M85_02340, partial [Paramuribaculum sp.]|nr:hypothetical protein [Paramuribaculum sp.]